jgi:uncharacterized membrane protein
MDWIDPWFFVCAIMGFIFLAAGWLMYVKPPESINLVYGYRTRRSMASQRNWEFSQKYSSRKLIQSGAILIVCSLAGFIFHISELVAAIAPLGIMIALVAWVYISTERAIKQLEKVWEQ